MPKLPRVPAVKVIRALERMGFVQVRQKGSHVILKKTLPVDEESNQEVIEVGCVVPLHHKVSCWYPQKHPEPSRNFCRRIFKLSLTMPPVELEAQQWSRR